MTVGQLAGMIAAVALVVLVIALIWFLVQVVKALREAITNLAALTQEATTLSHQADGILQNTNELLADLNHKAEKVDPAFVAMGEVVQSVSDLNTATRQFASHVAEQRAKRNKWTTKLGQAAAMGILARLKNRKKA